MITLAKGRTGMGRKARNVNRDNCIEIGDTVLVDAATSELKHLLGLGANPDLALVTANLGGYEAVLRLIAAGQHGLPVYQLVTGVQSRYASQAGVILRIRAMRDRGLLEQRSGAKKSQVCLVPSNFLLEQLGPILVNRHNAMRKVQ